MIRYLAVPSPSPTVHPWTFMFTDPKAACLLVVVIVFCLLIAAAVMRRP